MKKSLRSLTRALLAMLALSLSVSCLPTGGPYASSGGTTTTTRTQRAPLAATSFFFGGGGGGHYDRGYGSGYHATGYCRSCGYNPCRCSSGSRHQSSGYSSHDDHGHGGSSMFSRSSSSRSSSGSDDHNHKAEHPHGHDTYAVAGGSVRPGQTKPSGYHTNEWYKSRGYDTSKLKLVNEHGEKKGSSGSSSGGSSKSSSSKSKSSSSDDKKKR